MSRENPVMKAIFGKTILALATSLLLMINLATQSNSQMKKPEIAFLGDSLTAGYGLAPGEAYPELLADKLEAMGKPIALINAGVSGDTTSGGLARLDWSIPNSVSGVVLALGANDALRGIPVAQAKQNLEEIITRLKARGTSVLLAGMLSPPNMGDQYEAEFNAIYPDLAKKYDLAFYPFLLDGVAADASLNQADGIHPNIKGSKIIAEKFLSVFEQFLADIEK